MTTPAAPVPTPGPCPACGTGVGNNRGRCRTCNRYAQRVRRRAAVALAAQFPDEARSQFERVARETYEELVAEQEVTGE